MMEKRSYTVMACLLLAAILVACGSSEVEVPGRIVWDSEGDDGGDIYVMDADGSNLIRLTTNDAGDAQPAWAP